MCVVIVIGINTGMNIIIIIIIINIIATTIIVLILRMIEMNNNLFLSLNGHGIGLNKKNQLLGFYQQYSYNKLNNVKILHIIILLQFSR